MEDGSHARTASATLFNSALSTFGRNVAAKDVVCTT